MDAAGDLSDALAQVLRRPSGIIVLDGADAGREARRRSRCCRCLIVRLTAGSSTNRQVQRWLDIKRAAQDRWSHFRNLMGDLS